MGGRRIQMSLPYFRGTSGGPSSSPKSQALQLPMRTIGPHDGIWTGCSKRRSHRELPQFARFEIPHSFPRFPQIMGEWIIRRIKKKESGVERDHPCSKSFDTFLDCVRRHPDTYEKKCRTEAGRCLSCLEEHE